MKSRKGSLAGELEPREKEVKAFSPRVGGEQQKVRSGVWVTLGLELELREEHIGPKPVMKHQVRVW